MVELLADALLRWRDTPWGHSVLLPIHDEIIAMVPTHDGPTATTTLLTCMQTELHGIPITAQPGEPSHAWTDAT